MTHFIYSWGLIIMAAFVDVVAIMIIKLRLNKLGPIDLTMFRSIIKYCYEVISTPLTFTACILLLLSPVLYGFALSRLNLSSAYPVAIGIGCIFLIFVSYYVLNEPITLKKLSGIILILAGVFIIYK